MTEQELHMMHLEWQDYVRSLFTSLDQTLDPTYYFLQWHSNGDGEILVQNENFKAHPLGLERFERFGTLAQNNLTDRQYLEHVHDALHDFIWNELTDEPYEFFCAQPVLREGRVVALLLAFDEGPFSRYKVPWQNWIRGEPGTTNASYLNAVVAAFLVKAKKALESNNPRWYWQGSFANDLLIEAAREQTDFIVDRAMGDLFFPKNTFTLFNELAAMSYEGKAARGGIAISFIENDEDTNEHVTWQVRFEDLHQLWDPRFMRKLLEVSSESLRIISDGFVVYGLGSIRVPEPPAPFWDVCSIDFLGRGVWQLSINNSPAMLVTNGKPGLPRLPLDKEEYVERVRKTFADLSADSVDRLWQITQKCIAQKAGTLLIISDHAERETKRLWNQCTPVKKDQLPADVYGSITAIDGAVIIDQHGFCFAIGAILDGEAHPQIGSSARGARYNSACRYINERLGKQEYCLAIIVSEDGMVQMIDGPRLAIPLPFMDTLDGT